MGGGIPHLGGQKGIEPVVSGSVRVAGPLRGDPADIGRDRSMRNVLLAFMARIQAEEGQTMVEYGLILALVSVVAIVILQTLGTNVQTTFSSAASAL